MQDNSQFKQAINSSQKNIAKVHAAFEKNMVNVIPHHHHEQECRELLTESFDNLSRIKVLLDEMTGAQRKQIMKTTKENMPL